MFLFNNNSKILLEAKNVSDNVTINPEMISSSSRFAVYNALKVIMNELLHKQCGWIPKLWLKTKLF